MSMTIGKVAKEAGIGVETVRFYEREGLIAQPRRTTGYRQYDQDIVKRLCFIRRAKELGFTLGEIKELLDLRLNPRSRCANVKDQAEKKIENIQQKIRTLQRMKRALVKLTEACNGNGSTGECPILDTLEKGR